MRHREQAICVRANDFSETSQVVHFFTRGYGTVRLLAKGTKRPKSKSGGAIDLFAQGDLVFSTSPREALGTLMEFSESVVHSGLRRSEAALSAGLYMIELVGAMLPEGDPHADLFDLLNSALSRLEQPDARPVAVLAYFQWRLLRIVGLLGELRRCVGCGRALRLPAVAATTGEPAGGDDSALPVAFSAQQGGLLCDECQRIPGDRYPVDAAALEGIAVLASLQPGRRANITDSAAMAVNRLLHYHVSQQLGRPLRTARQALRG